MSSGHPSEGFWRRPLDVGVEAEAAGEGNGRAERLDQDLVVAQDGMAGRGEPCHERGLAGAGSTEDEDQPARPDDTGPGHKDPILLRSHDREERLDDVSLDQGACE